MYLVEKTIYKMFPATKHLVSKKRMELNDLMQDGYEGLWKACVNYKEGKMKFRTYAINYIRWHVMKALNKNNGLLYFQEKDRKQGEANVKIYDLFDQAYKDNTKGNSVLLCEVIPNESIDIEYDYISNETYQRAINCLTDKQKKILLAYLQDENQDKVAEKLGVSRQKISFHYCNAVKKIKELLEEEWRRDKMIV